MDSTTDLDEIVQKVELLNSLDPARAADLAAEIASMLASALDALENGAETDPLPS